MNARDKENYFYIGILWLANLIAFIFLILLSGCGEDVNIAPDNNTCNCPQCPEQVICKPIIREYVVVITCTNKGVCRETSRYER